MPPLLSPGSVSGDGFVARGGLLPVCTRVRSPSPRARAFPLPCVLQSLLGDGPLRLLLLPSIHLDALDLLSALILA